MTAIFQVTLWLFILIRLVDMISPKLDILKRRRKLRRLFKMYLRLYKNADTDYEAGFFYGQAKLFEKELTEMRFFNYD